MTKQLKRIFHTWDKWECYKAGFYETVTPNKLSKKQAEEKYADFLSDCDLFARVLEKIIVEWPFSCEQYLTNENMNRIAWLGQAAMVYHTGIPSCFRSGYNLLSKQQQLKADLVAYTYLNKWLVSNGYDEITKEKELSRYYE